MSQVRADQHEAYRRNLSGFRARSLTLSNAACAGVTRAHLAADAAQQHLRAEVG